MTCAGHISTNTVCVSSYVYQLFCEKANVFILLLPSGITFHRVYCPYIFDFAFPFKEIQDRQVFMVFMGLKLILTYISNDEYF